MGHSKKFQMELLARGLENNLAQLLERAKLLRDAGYLEMSEQVALQAQKLVEAIKKLRSIDLT